MVDGIRPVKPIWRRGVGGWQVGCMDACRRRRKRLSPGERAGVLLEYYASGLTQRDFAARAGVSLGTLGLWLRSARKPRTDAPAPPVSFAPVALKPESGSTWRSRFNK